VGLNTPASLLDPQQRIKKYFANYYKNLTGSRTPSFYIFEEYKESLSLFI